jgi:hypothetical protein
LSVSNFLLLVLLQTLLKLALQLLCLSSLDALGTILSLHSVQFEVLDLVPDLGVLQLRLRDQILELRGGIAVGRRQSSLVQGRDLLDI